MSIGPEKTGARVMLDVLKDNGVEVAWGIPGGSLLPFYDELYNSDLKHILVRHEQGAVHAADGYARVSGKTGVAIGTSGPGATNLITGIANAQMDSIPLLAITGQVVSSSIGTDAFQEADTYGLTVPITKYNALLKSADDVARTTEEALRVAASGRKGAVHIDFPKDIQFGMTSQLKPGALKVPPRHIEPTPIVGDLDHFVDVLNRASRPLLYIGGGAASSDASEIILSIAEKAKIPVVSTLMGLGVFPGMHRYNLGMLGMHGTAYANKAVMDCDLIIALGSRFDDRVASDVNDFARGAFKIQVDVDPAEANKRVGVDIYIQGDVREVLEKIEANISPVDDRPWVSHVEELRRENPLRFTQDSTFIKPQYVIHRLWEETRGEAIVATDVGQHQMWAAQFYPLQFPRHWVTSGGLGTMGFGLPASLGAKVARPDKEVILISGDGSFQMNLQELATARENDIKVKILLINNGHLGMVRQWQEMFHGNRISQSKIAYNPDFVKIASAYDIPAMRISKPDEIEGGVRFLLDTDDVALLEVNVPEKEKVFPMIPSGDAYARMLEYMHEGEGQVFEPVHHKEN